MRPIVNALFALLACGVAASLQAAPVGKAAASSELRLSLSTLESASKEIDKPVLSFPDIAEPDVSMTLTLVERTGKKMTVRIETLPFTHASGQSVLPFLRAVSTPQQPCDLAGEEKTAALVDEAERAFVGFSAA